MGVRVLVVDDDAGTCELIKEVLRSVEIEAATFTSSEEALQRLGKEKFDAIFADVNMPPPDGIEFTRKVRSRGVNASTPIMVITGQNDRTLLARAFEAGANFFLYKPIDRHDILRLVRATQDSIDQERRRFRRVRVRCGVSIESGAAKITGSTLDLSIGGMFVQATPLLSVGSIARVTLDLQSGSPMALSARVLRVSGDDCMGLQFEGLGLQQSKRLQEFLLPLIPASTA